MTQPKLTDYAAIIRSVKASTVNSCNLLASGNTIYSHKYGTGTVLSILGNRLIVKFPGYSVPVQFKEWEQALQLGEIVPQAIATITSQQPPKIAQSLTEISLELLQIINKPEFRAISSELSSVLTDIRIVPASVGKRYPLPENLPSVLANALRQAEITSLYAHQLEALEQLRKGKDLSITTPTASGKTLCYNLAILESCLDQPLTSALYIFPLKALAFDQLRKLEQLVAVFPSSEQLKVGQMTGDTRWQDRQQLFIPNPPHILAISPDLLHYQLEKIRRLEEWQPWREFLRQLRWVVIDESHTYIGAFGAHFANLSWGDR